MSVPGHSRQAWYQYNTRCNKRQEHHAQVLICCPYPVPPVMNRCRNCTTANMQADKTLNTGRDRLFNLLRIPAPRVPANGYITKTTNSHHRFYRHPNLLKTRPRNRLPPLSQVSRSGSPIGYLPSTTQRHGSSERPHHRCSLQKKSGYHKSGKPADRKCGKGVQGRPPEAEKTTGPLVHHLTEDCNTVRYFISRS